MGKQDEKQGVFFVTKRCGMWGRIFTTEDTELHGNRITAPQQGALTE